MVISLPLPNGQHLTIHRNILESSQLSNGHHPGDLKDRIEIVEQRSNNLSLIPHGKMISIQFVTITIAVKLRDYGIYLSRDAPPMVVNFCSEFMLLTSEWGRAKSCAILHRTFEKLFSNSLELSEFVPESDDILISYWSFIFSGDERVPEGDYLCSLDIDFTHSGAQHLGGGNGGLSIRSNKLLCDPIESNTRNACGYDVAEQALVTVQPELPAPKYDDVLLLRSESELARLTKYRLQSVDDADDDNERHQHEEADHRRIPFAQNQPPGATAHYQRVSGLNSTAVSA
ncbi:hypothetical protein [Bosea sp. LC85]|uniref:hypothetical protein n=1 Tax=Bosea sp. LC85 TaxID=1502851 RepID=UPI00126A1566|nr:hypothetical protein [Bosea sp. LC85]